jgi:hypothetical protein
MATENQHPQHNSVPPVAAMTEQYPVVKVKETRYYVCTVSSASMNRKDGKKLAFVNGIYKTDDKYDIEYLDAEIDAGNNYLREASTDEIKSEHMRVDPVGTMRADMEPTLRRELEEKIRREMAERDLDVDEDKVGGVDEKNDPRKTVETGNATVKLGGITGSDKIKHGSAG